MRDKKSRKCYPYLWTVLYSVLLVGYAVFTLLDAFVLPRDMVYLEDIKDISFADEVVPDDDGAGQSMEETEEPETDELEKNTETVITDSSYESEGVAITITTWREYDTQIYAAEVRIKDISYLRAGLAGGAFGRNVNETTSIIAQENNALLAVNGDFYGFRDRGFVMRNGYLYRDTARPAGDDDALVVDKDGQMKIVRENETDVLALAENAVHIFSFGPGLIQKGEILVNTSSEVEQAMRSNPRTAFGEIAPFHYVLLVSDGRTEESRGLSLLELAQVMQQMGCGTAYNLDGGGSSTMWFMGRVINHPASGWRSGERSVSDIVYIGE